MKLIFVLLALFMIEDVSAADPLFPCQCSLASPVWNEISRSVAYPPRFLIYETALPSPTDPSPQPVAVGEMWNKNAGARGAYNIDMWYAISALRTWYSANITPPTPPSIVPSAVPATLTLNAAQLAALTAVYSNMVSIQAKASALSQKP